MFLVVGVFVFVLDQVDGGVGGGQEYELHDGVVQRRSVPEYVDISCRKDDGVQNLTFKGYPFELKKKNSLAMP